MNGLRKPPQAVLALASPKGGVGKTTVALNMAFALAKRGWRTLLVDADPQGAVGLSLTGDVATRPGLALAVLGGIALEEAVVTTKLPEFGLLPYGRVRHHEIDLVARAMPQNLPGLWEGAGALGWEVIVVDTAGGLGGGTSAVLASATHVLSPLQAQPLALRVLPQILNAVSGLREAGSAVELCGLLLTMVDEDDPTSLRVVAEVEEKLPEALLLPHKILRRLEFSKASASGVPIGLLTRRLSDLGREFDSLASTLESRLNLRSDEESDEPFSFLI